MIKEQIKELKDIFKKMNYISKNILKYGSIPLIIIAFACLVLYITSGRLIDYYAGTQVLTDLLTLFKEMLGVIAVPALFIEFIDLATGKQGLKQESKDEK